MSTRTVELAYPAVQERFEEQVDAGEVVAFHFTTPAQIGPGNGQIVLTEAEGGPIPRQGAFNHTAGDLTTSIGTSGDSGVFNGDTGVNIGFNGTPQTGRHGGPKGLLLEASKDYYLNVQNTIPQGGKVYVTVTATGAAGK